MVLGQLSQDQPIAQRVTGRALRCWPARPPTRSHGSNHGVAAGRRRYRRQGPSLIPRDGSVFVLGAARVLPQSAIIGLMQLPNSQMRLIH